MKFRMTLPGGQYATFEADSDSDLAYEIRLRLRDLRWVERAKQDERLSFTITVEPATEIDQ